MATDELTQHALIRMAQRAIQNDDLDLISERCRASTLRDVMRIGPPVVLEKGRQCDGNGAGI